MQTMFSDSRKKWLLYAALFCVVIAAGAGISAVQAGLHARRVGAPASTLPPARLETCARFRELPLLTDSTLEPITITNRRSAAIIVQWVNFERTTSARRTIAPGKMWKTNGFSGQQWLFSDGDRCLFYVTIGREPLDLIVNAKH